MKVAHLVLSEVDAGQRNWGWNPSDERLHLKIRDKLKNRYQGGGYDEEDLAKGITLVQSVMDKIKDKGLHIGKTKIGNGWGETNATRIFNVAFDVLDGAIEEERERIELQGMSLYRGITGLRRGVRRIVLGTDEEEREFTSAGFIAPPPRSKPIGVVELEGLHNAVEDSEYPVYEEYDDSKEICAQVTEIYIELLIESSDTGEVVIKHNPEVSVKETPTEVARKIIDVIDYAGQISNTINEKEAGGSPLGQDKISDLIRSNLVKNGVPGRRIEHGVDTILRILNTMKEQGLQNKWEKLSNTAEGYNPDAVVLRKAVEILRDGVEAHELMQNGNSAGVQRVFDRDGSYRQWWTLEAFEEFIASKDGPVGVGLLRDWSDTVLVGSDNPRYKEAGDITIKLYEELIRDYDHSGIKEMFT